MSKLVLATLALLYSSLSIAYGEDDVVGTWKLVSAFKKDVETGEVSDAYGGPHPIGFLSYGYAGTYSISGNSVQHHIEASWNETWTGTTVTGDIKFEDGRLILTIRPQLRPNGRMVVVTLTWEKIK